MESESWCYKEAIDVIFHLYVNEPLFIVDFDTALVFSNCYYLEHFIRLNRPLG